MNNNKRSIGERSLKGKKKKKKIPHWNSSVTPKEASGTQLSGANSESGDTNDIEKKKDVGLTS